MNEQEALNQLKRTFREDLKNQKGQIIADIAMSMYPPGEVIKKWLRKNKKPIQALLK